MTLRSHSSADTSQKSAGQTLVVVFGGSGFLGRHVVRLLAADGYRVRVACRRPDLTGHLQPLGNVGQIQCVQANIRHRWSIERAIEGADVVVNLVGILSESGKQRFTAVHATGAGWVAEVAKDAGAKLVHISALGADGKSEAEYCRSKVEGEKLVRKFFPDSIIMRPSVIFGPEDNFFNRFAGLAALSPVMPMIGGGRTLFQPIYVGDVAQAVLKAVHGDLKVGSIWELGGPEVLSFKQCMEKMLNVIDRKRAFIGMPFGIARLISGVVQFFPSAPLTPGLVEMLKVENIVSQTMIEQGRTLKGMGIVPTSLAAVLPNYLIRFRKHGQFEANRGL